MNKPLFVFAKFNAQKNKVEAMKVLLQEFINETLAKEEGCISYTYLQSTEDETLFTSMEVWKDAEAETLHWQTQHIQKLLGKLPPIIEGEAEVTKYNRI